MASEMPSLAEDKLTTHAKDVSKMGLGTEPRKFFIEMMGADSVEKLLEDWDSSTHNSNWDSERQKTPRDLEEVMNQRKAIAFMESGRLCLRRMYEETELTARVLGFPMAAQRVFMLKRASDFATMKSKG